MKSRRQKVGHAPTRAGAWATVCRRGFLRWVDRPCVPRNLRSPAGEELAGKLDRKSHPRRRWRGDQRAIRRVSEGEESDQKETWSPEKKLGFPLWL